MNTKRNRPSRRAWQYAVAVVLLVMAGALLLARQGATAGVDGSLYEVVTAQPLTAGHDTQAALEVLPESAPQGGRPLASLTSSFHDFGRLKSADVVRHEFIVANRGQAPLVIHQAYTTCGCTTAEISARVIPPGKAARAVVVFDAGMHPSAGQTVRRGLIIETNDPEHPQVEIWVQARVEQQVAR